MAKKRQKRRRRSLAQRPPQPPIASTTLGLRRSIVGLLSFLTVAIALWDFYYACNPIVSPTFLDPNDPFAAPFSITNRSHWFVLYRTTSGCIPNFNTNQRNYVSMEAQGALFTGHHLDIPAGGTVQYSCPIVATGMKPDRLNIVIEGPYKIHLLPKVWSITRTFRWWCRSIGGKVIGISHRRASS
jgi:hypothetical protein